jgi:hypothetical protein
MMWRYTMKPISTTSAAVSEYIDKMKKDLFDSKYGKVGIVFTINNGQVTYVQEIKEKRYMLTKTVDEDT